MKLADPNRKLSTTESISLIEHCAQLGEQNADDANNKEVVLVLGNTGTGKSTLLNCLLGCEMKLVKPSELNLTGAKKVVIADHESTRAGIMPIGHEDSKTFMPQIAPDPDNLDKAYCGCPGFLNTRGEEINIADSLNINRVLQQATGVKAVFLTSYHGFFTDRGSNARAMEEMCHQMFGGIDNLRRHQNAVLLGITKAPLYEDDEPVTRNMVRSLLTKTHTPTIQLLANRIFLYETHWI